MTIKVGINGFGRTGRLVCRAAFNSDIEIVAINDLADLAEMAYMFKYDLIHGRFNGTVELCDGKLVINGKHIAVSHCRNLEEIPWSAAEAEYVVESTGVFTTKDKAGLHMKGGAKKVIITATSDDAPMFVMGVNEDYYDHATMNIVSNASCTINCFALFAKIIHDNFCIVEGLVTTMANQKAHDEPSIEKWRDGRDACENIIPASIATVTDVCKVIPELSGKLIGSTFRFPTSDVSIVELFVILNKCITSYDEIKNKIRKASEDKVLSRYLGYSEDEEVFSQDFLADTRSCIFDGRAGTALNDTYVKLVAWHNNEIGYSHRVCDLIKYMDTRKTVDNY